MQKRKRKDPLELSNREGLARVFEHLGGAATGVERLREVLHHFYARMKGDVLIGFFFDGRDTDAIADKQAELLLKVMGVRAEFTGMPPSQAHLKLPPILSGHFDRRLRLLEEVLRQEGLSDEDVATWVGFESAFRDVIVSRP